MNPRLPDSDPRRSSDSPSRAASFICLFLLSLLVDAKSAAGFNTTQIKTNYYQVSGASLRQIERSMRKARPWKEPMDARTAWTVKYRYTNSNQPGASSVKSFSTTTRITITLPRYNPPPGVTAEVTNRWNRYVKALGQHEAGHKAYALNAAAEIRRRANNVKTASDAATLKRSIAHVVDQVIAEFKEKEAAYDKKTNHGRNRGAVFP